MRNVFCFSLNCSRIFCVFFYLKATLFEGTFDAPEINALGDRVVRGRHLAVNIRQQLHALSFYPGSAKQPASVNFYRLCVASICSLRASAALKRWTSDERIATVPQLQVGVASWGPVVAIVRF